MAIEANSYNIGCDDSEKMLHVCKSITMVSQQRIFFDFLQFCIGSVADISASVKDADWKVLYAIAKKQALLGVLFYGIRRLPKELAPEQKLLMQWMVMAEQIRKQNIRLFLDSVKVCKNFEYKGFANCILKGQGNALLYPDPYMRTPGDIDIYLAGGRKRVMQYINKVCPNQVMRYHHADFPVMKTAIEVHFTPSYMFFPVHNRRMQKWFEEEMGEQCNHRGSLPDGYGEIHVPQVSFNVIYIPSHLYRHIFTEGIGLRQLLDYYFVICDFHKVYQNSSNHPVPLSKEGSTFSPSPSSSGSGDNSLLIQKDISPDKVDSEYVEFSREYNHAFLGELSWRELKDTQTDFTEDNASILVRYCFSEWTTKRFKYNNLVCLSSEICQMLKLTFNIDRLAYIFANEEVSASFICDDSTFFFLRKDIVDKLLKMKKSYLYIQMEEHRSITGKLPPNIEEPEMCYNKRVSYNSYSGISTRKSIDE